MILASRTKDAVEKIKEMADKMTREVLRHDERFKDYIDEYRIYPKEPSAMLLVASAERIPLAIDLKAKLLINKTSVAFIISDNPAIKYNQFLEKRKHPGGNTGILTKGLEVFIPLSPTQMLIYYDDWVYKVGDGKKDVIELTSSVDIDKLNFLQVLNCYDHLYFNEQVSEQYIRSLVNKGKRQRHQEYTSLQKLDSYKNNQGNEHIPFHTLGLNLEINIELSFINQTKKAKQHVLSDCAAQPRREELRGSLD